MKRTIYATVELSVFVDLAIDDEEQMTADPNGEIPDGEAAETAIMTSIRDGDVFVFGPDHAPARVHFDTIDVRIEGEE